MRVLMVITDLRVGGAEAMALELVRAAGGSGVHFTVAPVKGAEALRAAFVAAGAEVADPIAHFRFDPLGLVRMVRVIRRASPDVLLLAGVARDAMFYGLIGSALARRPRRRVLWCHSMPGGQAGRFVGRVRAFRRMGLIDRVICVSRRQQEAMLAYGLPGGCAEVVTNGVDIESIAAARPTPLPAWSGKKVVLQVANVMPDKDPGTLIRAAGVLARRRDDFRVVLVGSGTDSPEMARTAEAAGAGGVVSLLGSRQDVPGLLKAADAFVLSTRSEVFSVALLEAFAAGLPAVVSDLPAFDEMLADGQEGLRFPAGDAEALAGRLERLLDDADLRRTLGARAAGRARQFTRQRMAEGVLAALGARA